MGAVSSYKMKNRTERRIGYVSRIPLETERKCFTLKKEALFGVKMSHRFLYGQSFTIKMHREPLERTLKGKGGISSLAVPRNQRWARWAPCHHTRKRYRWDQWLHTDSFSRLPFPAMSDSDPLPGETILLMRHLKSTPPYTVGTLRSGPKETRHSLRCFATAWKDRPRQQIPKSELFATLNGVSWVWNTAVFFWELQLSYPIKGGLKCSLSCVRPIRVNLVWRCSPEVMFAGQD